MAEKLKLNENINRLVETAAYWGPEYYLFTELSPINIDSFPIFVVLKSFHSLIASASGIKTE